MFCSVTVHFISLRQSLSLNLELDWWPVSLAVLSSSAEAWLFTYVLGFELIPQACTASALAYEESFQLHPYVPFNGIFFLYRILEMRCLLW